MLVYQLRPSFNILLPFLFYALIAAQVQNGQFFTPALTILDSPSSSSSITPGQPLSIALDLSGNGKLPSGSFTPGNNLQTGYSSLNLFLVGNGINLTISEGSGLLTQEAGSTVKHLKWTVPECLAAGIYQLTIYEVSTINSQPFFTISSIPLNLASSGSSSKSGCSQTNAFISGSQANNNFPGSPWLSGETIQTGMLSASPQTSSTIVGNGDGGGGNTPAVISQSSQARIVESTTAAAVSSTTAGTSATSAVAPMSTSTPIQNSQTTNPLAQSINSGTTPAKTSVPIPTVATPNISSSPSSSIKSTSSPTKTSSIGSQTSSAIQKNQTSSSGGPGDIPGSTTALYGSITTTLYGITTSIVSVSPSESTLLTMVVPTTTYVTALPHGTAEVPWAVPIFALERSGARHISIGWLTILASSICSCIFVM